MRTLPRILITNDDGIGAHGIRHLWKSLQGIADVTIVAPASEQSSVGLSITVRQPLRIEECKQFGEACAWSVTGTPADCVKLALSSILKTPPDIIVSGINRGNNAGRNVLYSGTVAGVIEGIMHDIPGIAFSCWDYNNPDYLAAERCIPSILQHVLDHPLPSGTLLNVNFPPRTSDGIQGFKMTQQGREFWGENPEKRQHPTEEHSYYWLGFELREFPEEDSDCSWLRKGYVTAVPVHVSQLTDHSHLQQRKALFEELFKSF